MLMTSLHSVSALEMCPLFLPGVERMTVFFLGFCRVFFTLIFTATFAHLFIEKIKWRFDAKYNVYDE